MIFTYEKTIESIQLLSTKISQAKVKYDYICALVRGGTIPATMLSHKLNIPMFAISCSLRDHKMLDLSTVAEKHLKTKRILVVDDIIDSGDSARAVQQIADPATVDFCALIYNQESGIDCKYYAMPIRRSIDTQWIKFFWE